MVSFWFFGLVLLLGVVVFIAIIAAVILLFIKK